MSWRSLFIGNKVELTIQREQLRIKSAEEVNVPLEDISVIVIENLQAQISTYTLSKFAEYNILVFICDEKHMPNGIYLPFFQHSRVTKVAMAQMKLSKPNQNRVWQRIVEKKILNQAEALNLSGLLGADKLKRYASQVQSADKSRKEGAAAREYFKIAFPEISRKDDHVINSALNYGYAILRGAIARSIAAYGLLPMIGVGHISELNNFNLADDLIEMFRPIVDLYTIKNIDPEMESLSREKRGELVNLLNHDMELENQHLSVLNAIERVVESYQKVCLIGDFSALVCPALIPLKEHEYE